MPPDRLDELRQTHPTLGFALYALVPGEPVTLEIITPEEELFTFKGETVRDVLDTAFPTSPTAPAAIDIFS